MFRTTFLKDLFFKSNPYLSTLVINNLVSKVIQLDGIYKNKSQQKIKDCTEKSNNYYVSCTNRNAMLMFCQEDKR